MNRQRRKAKRSYLATEELIRVVKDLESKNLVVPLVGDFAGTKALRGIGRYVRDHQGVVTTFYLSNVEQYGRPVGQWGEFCGNVAEMPLDGRVRSFDRSAEGGVAVAADDSTHGSSDSRHRSAVCWLKRVTAVSRYPEARAGHDWTPRLAVAVMVALCVAAAPVRFAAAPVDVPDRLSDREFWQLIQNLSEPAGFFNSDNLVSNEDTFQDVIPELIRTVEPGGVYVGVGPDQNFTYIAAVNPSVAFIPDVRRGNLQLHLMYKALFALSADRVEFLSRLFSRRKPEGVAPDSSAQVLMAAFAAAEPDRALFDTNLRAVLDYLARHRGERLDDDDRAGIEFVHNSFFAAGPELAFVSNAGFRRARYPSVRLAAGIDRSSRCGACLSGDRTVVQSRQGDAGPQHGDPAGW